MKKKKNTTDWNEETDYLLIFVLVDSNQDFSSLSFFFFFSRQQFPKIWQYWLMLSFIGYLRIVSMRETFFLLNIMGKPSYSKVHLCAINFIFIYFILRTEALSRSNQTRGFFWQSKNKLIKEWENKMIYVIIYLDVLRDL